MAWNVATKALQLFKPKVEPPPVLDEDGEIVRAFIMDNHFVEEYPNGLKYYVVKIEENSPIWNRLRLN